MFREANVFACMSYSQLVEIRHDISMAVLIAIASVSMYWQTIVLPIHIYKLGARDISVLLRHYDVVLFLEYTLPYMI